MNEIDSKHLETFIVFRSNNSTLIYESFSVFIFNEKWIKICETAAAYNDSSSSDSCCQILLLSTAIYDLLPHLKNEDLTLSGVLHFCKRNSFSTLGRSGTLKLV